MQKIILISIALLFFCASIDVQASAEEEVTEAFNQLMNAMVEQDEAKLGSLAADDLMWGHTGGELDDKATFVKKMTDPDFRYLKTETRDQTVRLYGDIAIIRNIMDGDVQIKGDADKRASVLMSTVWHKRDGKWQVVDRQAALLKLTDLK